MLAVVDYRDPLLWAAFIGWIMSVVLHEFAHGIVAYWGGDYTIKDRGGLTLNPFQYIDPVFSILIPAVIFVMGGVPLPGGVTYVRRDLIRNRSWQIATSAAGPAMNFLVFLLLVLPMHPTIGWIHPSRAWSQGGAEVSNVFLFMGAMAWLQMLSVILNLIPVPPLDGFQVLAELLEPALRDKLMALSGTLFLIFFMVIWQGHVFQYFHNGVEHTLDWLEFDRATIAFMGSSYNRVLFGTNN